MATTNLKEEINFYLQNADDKLLRIVHGVFKNYYEDEIVAFFPNGEPMTKKEYITEIDTAIKQVNEGDIFSIEEIENEK